MKQKSGKCPEYLAFVRSLPCLVCYELFWQQLLAQDEERQAAMLELMTELSPGTEVLGRQLTPTEAAHAGKSTSVRGLGQKYPDREAIPLCRYHHREAKDSHHAGTAVFWAKHPQLDRDGLLKMLWRVYGNNPSPEA